MALAKIQKTIFEVGGADDSATPAEFASCTITVGGTGGAVAATLYDNQSGIGAPISNPVITGANGLLSFYVEPGLYDIEVTHTSGTQEWSNEPAVNPNTIESGTAALQFSNVANMKSGTALNLDGTVAFSDYVGRLVETVEYYDGTNVGGAKYKIETLTQHRADIGDPAWVPDGYGDHYLLGGTTYVAVLSTKSRIVDAASFGVVFDYNKSTFTGTDNTAEFQAFLIYIGESGYCGTWEGLFLCNGPILCEETVTIKARNKNKSAVYFPATLTSGTDCLTFKLSDDGSSGGGLWLEGFSVLGAYSTATSTNNKGLVTRQCARTTFRDVVISNFDICYHQDGGFLNNYYISLTNYRTSPLRYTFNEYSDVLTTGVAHNVYYGLVVAHELITGAGKGIHLLQGEVTFIHPRAEDQGQEFFTIEHLSNTIQNIYIINPQNRSDVAGVRGRCLHLIGDPGDVIKDVHVISPDFISDDGYDVIAIDGSGIENINIEGGKIEGGDNGLFITNGARAVTYAPSYSKRHELHAVLCNSTGAGNYFYPKTVSECNQSATLSGNDQAFIKFDTAGQRGMVGPTTFMDASCQWGVSRPSGANPNVRTAVTTDYTGTMAGTNRNVQFAEVGSSGTQTYTATNVTTDRSYDANTVTVAELADVVGTLISDLRAQGKVL